MNNRPCANCVNFKLLIAVALLSMFGLSTVAHAQQKPDQNALQDQMRQNFETIRQRMQEKGINWQDIMTPGMDPSEMQQKLLDKGVIDQDFANQMQSTMQQLTTSRLRDELQCSDGEFAIMQPLIQKVAAALRAVGEPGAGMRMMGFSGGPPSPSAAAVNKAKHELHAAIADVNTTPEQFAAILKELREAQDKARDELAAARQELLGVLNVRQEAALSQMGLLD